MKEKYDGSAKNICEYIFNDYIDGMELEETNSIAKDIPMLISNNLACKICGNDYLVQSGGMYRVACKFIQKYNKSIHNSRRKLYEYEFGGSENVFAKNDKRLVKLSKYALQDGTYFAQVGKSEYCMFIFKASDNPDDDEYTVLYELYFIGKKWKKSKDSFYEMYDKYKKIKDAEVSERIYYTDGKPSSNAIFKPFSQIIFKDKDKVIKYIDNWVNNIPIYYDQYKMISKLSIILYGQPGTGKSTFCKGLANYLKIDSVTSVSPSYFSSDDDNMPRGGRRCGSGYNGMPTVYALDDVDCVCKSREISDTKENNEILANLLSFLDNPPTFFFKAKNGIHYPISIVVATTNYYDKLDDAVKRYGRFDLKIEMKEFNKTEAQEMCDIYHLNLKDIAPDCNNKDFKISPSYLQAKCLENVDINLKKVD